MISLFIYWHIDDSIHTPADKKIHRLPLQFPVGTAVTYDCRITVTPQNVLHSRDDLGAERIVQFRNHNADGFGRIGLQSSGNLIDFIVKLLNGFFNLYSVFFSDIPAIKIRRDRCQTKSCLSGNVFHRCCHPASLPFCISYSALPSHPQTFILAITSSLTAAIAVLPYAFGSIVSGFSARSSLTALE